MSNLEVKLNAMIIHQREGEKQRIYLSKIRASEFASHPKERFLIDYYKRNELKDSGYQRQLGMAAVNKIKNFVLEETNNPLLPTAILVNSRFELDFKESKECKDFGTLIVNNPLYIIDGQHRYEAWKSMMESPSIFDDYGDYEFPLIILSGFEEYQEIEQFYVINSRQKKIKTDLAQRHLLALAKRDETRKLISDKDRWQLYATKMVDLLNEQIDGVWKNKIILPSDNQDERTVKIITQSSFISSLKPLFTSMGSPFFDISEGEVDGGKVEAWANLIAVYWNDIELVYPEVIKNFRQYSLMKTVGVFSLHLLLQKEYARIESKNMDEAKA